MSVLDNVAYGLVRGGPSRALPPRRGDVEPGARRPRYGGRRRSGRPAQRVALARALINQPEVLLLDEPLGALDLKLRQQMQSELKALQRKVGITFVYVTHDQEEALGMIGSPCSISAGSSRSARRSRSTSARRPPSSRASSGPPTSSMRNRRTPDRARSGVFAAARADPAWARPEDGDGTADHGVDGTVISVQYHGASTRVEVALARPPCPHGRSAERWPSGWSPAAGCGCHGRRPPCSRWTAREP